MAISLRKASDVLLYAPRNSCVLVVSAPGTGKSATNYAAAKRAGALYIEKYTAIQDTIDNKGVPYLVEAPDGKRSMAFAPPHDWPTFAALQHYPETQEIRVNLDDWGQAPPPVKRATARAFYGDGIDRKLGDVPILPNVIFSGTSNREQDRAGSGRDETHYANRVTYVEVEPSADEWVSGALGGWPVPQKDADYDEKRAMVDRAVSLGTPDTVIAFVKQFQCVYEFSPDARSFMSPRSLNTLGMFIRAFDAVGINGDVLHEVACGTIGEAQAVKFMAFHKLRDEIPSVQDILKGEDVKLPAKSEILYILCTALLRAAKKEHTDAVAKFLDRLSSHESNGMRIGVEVSAYLMKECLHGESGKELRGVRSSPVLAKWLRENGKFFM